KGRRRRVVAPDQKSNYGWVVAQQTRLAGHRGCGHLLVRGIPRLATCFGCRFPFVATFPARQNHDAVTIGEVVEAFILQLPLAAQGVESEVENITKLGL